MKRWICHIVLLTGLWACKEKYIAQVASTDKNILVVEGFINVGPKAVTTIILSRTTELSDPTNKYETKAKLEIQSKTGAVYNVAEVGNGVYSSAVLNLPIGDSYRLHINTAAGKEYFSDYTVARSTPAITGISMEKMADGSLRLYADSRINANDSRYYQWKTEETWEIRSQYESRFIFTKNNAGVIIDAKPTVGYTVNTSIKTCWPSQASTSIMLGNLEKFTTDSIHELLVTIPAGSQKLGVLYSIEVKQYAISHPAYLFLDAIRKNTEQLGSLFDAQPSNLNGNIHCVSHPAEQVIGFVDVTQEQTKRFFIRPGDVPGGWVYQQACKVLIVDSIRGLLAYAGYLPLHYLDPYYPPPDGSGDFGTATCVDCTLTGTNIKPLFWP